jgi:hypothetical protein
MVLVLDFIQDDFSSMEVLPMLSGFTNLEFVSAFSIAILPKALAQYLQFLQLFSVDPSRNHHMQSCL